MISSSSDPKPTPRFGSLSSPSSYRPSYSGGTYRSIGIRRDTPTTPSYSSRWLNKEVTTKETAEPKKSPAKAVSNDTTKSTDSKLAKNGQVGTSSSVLNKTKPKETSSTPSRPSVTLAKVRIRDTNSTSSSYSVPKSRDPSPSEPAKDRYTSSSGYVSSSYSKLYPRTSNKLQVNSFNNRSSLNSTSPAVSYLNGSDVGGRYRQNTDNDEKPKKISTAESSPTKETATTTTGSDSSESQSESSVEMIEVTVVTRATSPNLCPSTTATTFSRCRRAEFAKTIEKTIKRPKRKPNSEDKEMQSDRMDDTSKYSRFSGSRSTSPWPSSYMENKYSSMSYSRFNSGSSTTSMPKYSPTTKSERESTESPQEKSVEKSVERSPEKSPSKSSRESSVSSKSPSISRSNSIKSVSKSEKSKSKSPPVPSPSSSKSTSTSPSKSAKVYNNKTLPPQPPKLESPTKVISVSSSASTTSSANATSSKWANKDFRKSALNVGQTDRPRKARTSSASTDNEDSNKKTQQKPASNQISYTRSDRSPSVSSETSYSSGGNAEDMTKNFMKLKISPPPTTATAKATTTAIETAAASAATAAAAAVNSTEMMHLNSDMMTYDMKSQPNDAAVQIKDSPHSNDSCTKIDNTKTTIVNRVLAPVVNLFKSKPQHLGESQSGSDHESAISTNDSIKPDTLNESVLNRTTTTITSNGTKLVSSNNYLADESSWLNSTLNEQTTDTQFDKFQSSPPINMKAQLRHVDSSNQVSWWFQDTENDDTIAEDITLNQSDSETTQINRVDVVDSSQTNPTFPWWMQDEATTTTSQSDLNQKYRITHNRSGERAWWLDEDTEESVNDILEAAENENDSAAKFTFKIKKIESGERAWWLCEENKDTMTTETVDHTIIDDTIKEEGSIDVDFWASINESLEADRIKQKAAKDEMRKLNEQRLRDSYQYDINANYISLGARASPEGLEDYNNNTDENRLSPYDNVDASNVLSNFKKLFISKHQNIDEVLGAPCHALSPIRIDADEPFEEILPSQVRIHDGTAQKLHMTSER